MEPSTLLQCLAPASVTYGIESSTNEDGNMDRIMEIMTELLEVFHRLDQLLIEILAIWDKIAGIVTKITKFVKPPFPGSGILTACYLRHHYDLQVTPQELLQLYGQTPNGLRLP
ncbi:uncharacterized protein FFB20_09611 [Fusarium fujikuroi]|uniref:Uncharacterized protein n=1 Tax=Fusarium fujikuroi TaxID=5127 RepID=A0A2H3RRR8_FUSFU|nr:Uncharacterized protein Y057_8678 [Fusarium fujikuroi]SCN66070.1 uncharacterized protein FFE2_00231 [Fusarium fujikuroi]SCN68964.1 uncharacterized protein FFC1_00226 [Fusarium fujikuroi]SCN94109.1 uncharacterized protein FFB20_09611 [Fusarium fujikuroi]SCO28263.1 uncharacterized protein FFNC_00229 [Fusarium fujikuroi]